MYRVTAVVVTAVCLWASAGGAPVVITGKVVNQAGQPVAGAEVRLVLQDPTEVVRLQSDERGGFRWEWDGRREVSSTLTAIAPGLAAASALVDLTDPHPVLLRLAPEARLRGIVRDEGGRPVEGAEVVLQAFRPEGAEPTDFLAVVWFYPEPPIHGMTGADGKFDLGGLPKGATAHLQVLADGFASWAGGPSEASREPIAGSPEEYEVRLERGGFVEGTVTRDGQPAAGVRVFAGPVRGSGSGDEAVTDAQGRYRLAHLAETTVNVELDEVEGLVAAARENVVVVAGQTVTGIDLHLTPGGLIEGRVVDAETGAPVANARVGSYGPSRPRSTGACISVRLDEAGTYRMRVAAGSSRVYYQGGSEGYPYSEDASFDIDVEEGQTVKAPDLKVKRVEPTIVRVVDAEGAPAANARVTYYSDWRQPLPADAEGQCAIHGLRPGQAVVVTASDAEGKLAGATVVRGARAGEPVTVTVDRPACILLQAVDKQGEPLPGVTVELALTAQAPRAEGLGPLEAYCHARIAKATSNEAGELRFEGLPAGVTPEVLFTEKTASTPEWPELPLLEPGATYDLGSVALDLRRMPVHGTVVLPDETPVPGATVVASMWEGPRTRTDERGGFVLEGFAPSEEVLVLAASPDRKLYGGEVVVPEWELEPAIVLNPPIRVTGRLVGADGKPLARRTVQSHPPSGLAAGGFPAVVEAKTDDTGGFVLAPLMPGIEYQLNVKELEGPMWRLVSRFTPEPGADMDLGVVKPMEPGDR